jgi:hypothetical protein
MDYTRLTKKLLLPVGAAAPRRLVYNDLVATAISRIDLADDVRGINASLASFSSGPRAHGLSRSAGGL